MAPKRRKFAGCAVCSKHGASYRCPADDTPYCSLACFKTHKETVCVKTLGPAAPPADLAPSADAEPSNPAEPVDVSQPPPLKRLKRLQDLDWPGEPDSALWTDPLARDDVKPLRRHEYEAIARSSALRDLLRSDPAIASVLKRVQGRTEHIRALLSLPPGGQSREPRPGFLPEEQAAAQKFARVIANVLDAERGTSEAPKF